MPDSSAGASTAATLPLPSCAQICRSVALAVYGNFEKAPYAAIRREGEVLPRQDGAMRAILVEQFGVRPAVADVPDPVAAEHGVTLQVAATGLCRSDWHGWQGHDPGIRLPHVPGHEIAGTIAAVGRDERGFDDAATLGCRFATAYRAVRQIGRVAAGEWVAVFGCGGVGLSAVMIAAASGARVIAIDISPDALALAAGQ